MDGVRDDPLMFVGITSSSLGPRSPALKKIALPPVTDFPVVEAAGFASLEPESGRES